MRKNIVLLCLQFFSFAAYTQVAVNTSGALPHTSAMLDVSAANKGLLVPNISLSDVGTATPVTSPATGLLVWNTNASVTGGSGAGFYFWDGSKWQNVLSDNTGWRLRGNGNTSPGLHFLGTTDDSPLFFRVNNKDVGKIDPSYANLFLGAGAGFSWSSTNARRNTLVGDSAGFSNTTGSDNSFFGSKAGHKHSAGFGNSFFGSLAGSKLQSGNYNSFFGHAAGRENTGTGNSFFGETAGMINTGSNNAIFGRAAGSGNTNGSFNCFFGSSAADFGTAGSSNCFFGFLAGSQNEANRNNFFGDRAGLFTETGHHNSFFGSYAGYQNNTGNFNVYIGDSAGYRSGGSFNTIIGSRATNGSTFGLSTVNNSTAIGYLAQVDADNSMVLGGINGINGATADTKVGIGTTEPASKLHVVNIRNNDGGWADGIVVENTAPFATAGEAAISFRNASLPANKQWTVGINQQTPALAFSYGTNFSGANSRMAIDSFGNVGIGTITPDTKLDVNGGAKIGTNGSVLTNIIKNTATFDIDGPAGLVAGSSLVFTVAVANAAVGSTVFVSPENALSAGSVIAYARVSAAGTVEIKITNAGNVGVNQAAMDLYITVIQ